MYEIYGLTFHEPPGALVVVDHITPAVEVASRHRLRSANRHRLIVPRCRLNTSTTVGFSGRWSDGLELTAR